jgi:ribonuclease-3
LVCEKSLTAIAQSLELGNYLLLGRGEEKGGGRNRPSILADAVEAIIAAIYLDNGLNPVISFVKEQLFTGTEVMQLETTDHKTTLQEFVQMKPGQDLIYSVIDESGPDHLKSFTVEARLNNDIAGVGVGKSKKEAEQAAAMEALSKKRKLVF